MILKPGICAEFMCLFLGSAKEILFFCGREVLADLNTFLGGKKIGFYKKTSGMFGQVEENHWPS